MEDLSMFQRPRTVALEDEKPGTYGTVLIYPLNRLEECGFVGDTAVNPWIGIFCRCQAFARESVDLPTRPIGKVWLRGLHAKHLYLGISGLRDRKSPISTLLFPQTRLLQRLRRRPTRRHLLLGLKFHQFPNHHLGRSLHQSPLKRKKLPLPLYSRVAVDEIGWKNNLEFVMKARVRLVGIARAILKRLSEAPPTPSSKLAALTEKFYC
ncbi:hypothetical protein PIB30_013348 [Stylosanthes scabra]|uniref:Uncharacterized protein n=1 Tax=Stylosanthes scabra TaxID=79078 RepID=A0ABU6U556_9FABA|nr:hypothetical protein [Stylosanthes scabra]